MQRQDSDKMALHVEMKVTRTSRVAVPDADMNWIVKNYKKLQSEYPEKWIAVKNTEVVASDPDLEPLLSKLREQRGNTLGFAIEFIGANPRNLLI